MAHAHAPPISLSAVTVHKLTPSEAKLHRDSVADLLHRKTTTFPGAQPVSFARHHLRALQTRDYFMCEKTDGIRCLLYLTSIPGPDGHALEAQFLIDRKNDYYFVQSEALHVPTEKDMFAYHTGTLLDGELVSQRLKDGSTKRTYLIFDLLAIDGESVLTRPFDKRLVRIQTLIWSPLKAFMKQYADDVAQQPFSVEMKQMEFPYAMEAMFRDKIPNLPHGNDGLIFTCRETRYESGTDQNILKWKPPVENTVDFRLVVGEFPWVEDEDEEGGGYEDWDALPVLELWINHSGHGRNGPAAGGGDDGYKFFAPLTLTPSEWTALRNLNTILDGRIIECYRDPSITDRDVWRPKLDAGTPRFRDDKTDANHVSTVTSVLESIQDAVTEEDLIGSAGAIRKAFKERQGVQREREREAVEAEKRRRAEFERLRVEREREARREGKNDGDDDGQPGYDEE